jgi:predicted ATPase
MVRLVDRIVTSCERHEAGEGHYLHGSFGSGKSHFMAILRNDVTPVDCQLRRGVIHDF